ncbi:MAG: non-heme iron oxygenase ferredoxin subunit [Actinomyces sp.]|nr:MAG: non-heme iron oxygenase ferredoxin subunit [Actinomyces sp.]
MTDTSELHEVSIPLDEVEPGSSRRIVVAGIPVAVVRIDDDVYAVGDTCTHAEVSLSEGEVDPDDATIECPRHGAVFDLRTGEPLTLPATRPVPVFDARIDGDRIVVTVRPGEGS